MANLRRRWIFALVATLCVPMASQGQTQNVIVPLRNWTVPPYAVSSTGGVRTMTDVTPPRAFIGIQPCRVADTRGNGAPITGGIFANNEQRTWDVTSICGIPAGADAISVNFTVVTPAGTPSGGFLVAWPTGQSVPPTSVMSYGPGAVILANAAIVPLGPSEQLNVNVNFSTHILMDVNGYFSDLLSTTTNAFELTSATAGLGTIRGQNTSTSTGSSGVFGSATATSGTTFGVLGKTSSTALDSAGVKGIDASGSPQSATTFLSAGVRGESLTNLGLLGISQSAAGVQGTLVNSTGAALAEGKLGVLVGGTYYGLFAATGDVGVTGTKSFVVPHPTEPGVVIRYVSLEGPEAGTYFRGRARTEEHEAVIEVPEIFRLVTEEEGLSVQVTPTGRSASLWVEQIGLDRIVVRGTRDVEFFYTVNGVRKGYSDFQPMSHGEEFIPESASARLPEGLSPEAKRRLIANGTYNPDGTVNMQTAERMGWTRVWAARDEAQ